MYGLYTKALQLDVSRENLLVADAQHQLQKHKLDSKKEACFCLHPHTSAPSSSTRILQTQPSKANARGVSGCARAGP